MNKIFIFTIIILILFNFCLLDQQKLLQNNNLEISILDIGQGDSILIKTPHNTYGLIDTGRENKVIEELGAKLPFFFNTFEFIILTHPDADHVEGFLALLKKYEFQNIFIEKVPKQTILYDQILNELQNLSYSSNIYSIKDNNDFKIGDIYFDVLWPEELELSRYSNDVNQTSISILLTYKSFTFYSAGDLGKDNELKSLESLNNKNIDILKVGHHGSNTSTSEEFIKETNTKIGVISVGKNNSYNHPSLNTIGILEKEKVTIYRTDLDGRITIDTNGEIIHLNTQNGKFLTTSAIN